MSDTATTAAGPTTTIAAPPAVQRTFNETLMKVAGQTGVQEPAPVAQEVVKVVPTPPAKPDAPPSADLPPGSVPPVAGEVPPAEAEAAPEAITDTPPASDPEIPTAPELVGEIASEEDGLKLTAERNADGTFKTKLDPKQKLDFSITDKETGETKTYSKTIPELMRLAKDGIWGQKVRNEVSYYRENVPRWQEQVASMEAELADQQALNRELLSAPDEIVIQRREEYAREMAPENRLARENAELRRKAEAAERQGKMQHIERAKQEFLVTRGLDAAIRDAEAKLGARVVAGELSMGTVPFMVNGSIPPQHWPKLEQYIKGPFAQWVAAEVAAKTEVDRKAALARQATEEAQRKAQTAVNDSTRTMIPVGRAAPDAPPELPKPKNAQEAIHRMVTRPLPSTVAQGV